MRPEAALRAGFDSFGCFDVPVRHWIGGRFRHPFVIEADEMTHVALRTRRVEIEGHTLSLIDGRACDLSPREAEVLMRRGLVEPIVDGDPTRRTPEQPRRVRRKTEEA